MAESFAKLGDSIYFHDDDGVYVNLFVPSEVTWREKGIGLVQETRFPEQDTLIITVRAARPTRMALRVRVPYWTRGGSASLNGHALEGFAAPQSYFVVDRVWKEGDRLSVKLPMHLHVAPMPDDASVQAVMYGPLVLAGKLGAAGLTKDNLRAEPTKPRTVPEYKGDPLAAPAIVARENDPLGWVQPIAGRPLEFKAVGQASELMLVPLNCIFDERYVVYWRVTTKNIG
jgi:hypothetical protein